MRWLILFCDQPQRLGEATLKRAAHFLTQPPTLDENADITVELREDLPLARSRGTQLCKPTDNARGLSEAVRDRGSREQFGKVNVVHLNVAAKMRWRLGRAVFQIGKQLAPRDRDADRLEAEC